MGKYNELFKIDIKFLNLCSAILNIMRSPIVLKERNTLLRNEELLQYKKSDTCYIIGLGPSLKEVDLSKIDGDIIATNRFVFFEEAKKIAPTFYCLQDSAFFNSQNSHVLEAAIHEFPDTVFLLNGKDKRKAESIIGKYDKAYYTFSWKGYLNAKTKIDFCKVLPLIGNVVCYAIMLALYLGYKNIYLLGCDFSSFASRRPAHCYKDNTEKREISMAYELFCYSFVSFTHEQLEKNSKRNNISIINITDNSLIDAYFYDEYMIEHMKKK